MDSNVFTEKEQKFLDKNLSIRDDVIEMLYKEVKEGNTKAIRMLSEMLNGQDSSINTTANTRLKNKEVSADSSFKDNMVELLKSIKLNDDSAYVSVERDFDKKVSDEYTFVGGELQMGIKQLDPEAIINGVEDEVIFDNNVKDEK